MSTTYGLPLTAPVTQSLIPVVVNHQTSSTIVGYFPIAATEFAGTETEFELSPGTPADPENPDAPVVEPTTIDITTVTVKRGIVDPNVAFMEQYVAQVLTWEEGRLKPWLGYPTFISANDTGYYSDWFSTTTAIQQRFNPGVLVNALRFGIGVSTASQPAPIPPEAGNSAVTWHAQMGIDSVNGGNLFFDFPWITQFEATNINDSSVPMINVDPTLRIEVLSNPPGGEFKAALVGMPVPTSNGDVRYDTMRIIRLKNQVELGTYEFKFRIVGALIDQEVVLSLTII